MPREAKARRTIDSMLEASGWQIQNLEFRMNDFEYTPFAQRGGVARAYQLFGDELEEMLTDLTDKLVS